MTTADEALGHLPASLRAELLERYNAVITDFRAGRWEPSELNGGKFCEVVYSILKGHVDGTFPKKSKKPPRFDQACRDLEQADAKLFTKSVRVHVPRVLIALYGIRNDRGVGHVGGDVDPNHMDAVWVVGSVKWVLSELIRLFHDVDVKHATEVVEALTDRAIPAVWEVGGKRRVLHTHLSMRDKTLLLLHGVAGAVPEKDLVQWVEHSNASIYRRDVLKKAHKDKLVEYDQAAGEVTLSPIGARYVEENLPLEV
jgi:hypothetical protein